MEMQEVCCVISGWWWIDVRNVFLFPEMRRGEFGSCSPRIDLSEGLGWYHYNAVFASWSPNYKNWIVWFSILTSCSDLQVDGINNIDGVLGFESTDNGYYRATLTNGITYSLYRAFSLLMIFFNLIFKKTLQFHLKFI